MRQKNSVMPVGETITSEHEHDHHDEDVLVI